VLLVCPGGGSVPGLLLQGALPGGNRPRQQGEHVLRICNVLMLDLDLDIRRFVLMGTGIGITQHKNHFGF